MPRFNAIAASKMWLTSNLLIGLLARQASIASAVYVRTRIMLGTRSYS